MIRALMTLLAVCLYSSTAMAQVLSVNQQESCEGTASTFYILYPKAISSYTKAELTFGDGQSVDLLKFQNPKAHHYYYEAGSYKPKLELTERGGNIETFTGKALEIKNAPDFKMLLSGQDSQCFKDNRFVWQGPWKSTAGSELTKWEWDFGDGTKVNKRDPEYSYPSPGTYSISLTCRDAKGCEQTETRDITVHDSFSVRFNVKQDSVPPGTVVKFTNLSTIDSANVAFWVWDWGTSTKSKDTFSFDSTNYLWNQVKRPYDKDGYHTPKLVVRSKNNCTDSFSIKDRIRIVSFKFDVTWFPNNSCFKNNLIRFNMPPRPNATQLKWSFGDSLDVLKTNYNQEDWSPAHHYTQPGYYNVKFSVWEPPLPYRDTTVCFVKVKGPMAKILRNDARNNHTPIKAIETAEYQRLKNDIHYRLRSGTDSIRYWHIQKVKPFIVDSVAEYVNAPMQVSREVERTCKGDTVWRPTYSLQPTSYRKVLQDYLLVDSGYWHYLSPIPTDSLYHPPSGKSYMHNMHDSDLYHPAPFNMVQFSNNSVKYRLWGDSLKSQKPLSLRYAWDNIPGEFPDKGRNPNYPWASDSLAYFWNFGDDKAPQCTSSVTSPNTRCAYSTEVAPKHIYRDMGVYHSTLTVNDPVINCFDSDTVTITMIEPRLVSERGKVFNWYEQRKFDSLNNTANLGFRMKGHNCIHVLADQTPDFSGLGINSKYIDNYWLVFDVAEQCDTVFYNFEAQGLLKDSFYLDCDWISKKEFEGNKSIYNYKNGGWKSIGVVLKIGDAFDTLFIKNYKWMYHPKMQVKLDYEIKPLTDSFELKMTFRDSTSSQDSTEMFQYYLQNLNGPTSVRHSDSLQFPEGKDTLISLWLRTTDVHAIWLLGTSNKKQTTCYSSYPVLLDQNVASRFDVEDPIVCVNEEIEFEESVSYYGIETWSYFGVPRDLKELYAPQNYEFPRVMVSYKKLFENGFSNPYRQKWLQDADYQLPEFEEQLAWDFNGDSLFDAYGSHPKWSYPQTGEYHPQLYTRDSTGFWLRVGLDAPIQVIGANPKIVADNSSLNFVCTGTPVNFSAKTADTATVRAYQWRVSPTGSKSSTSAFQWIPNEAGSYTIYLQTEGALGCSQEVAYGPIAVRSPIAGFEIAPYQDSCIQLEFELRNTSTDADTLYWLLNGNVLAKTDAVESSFQLQLPYYGNHFVSQFAVGRMYDSIQNEFKTCGDAFPNTGKKMLDVPGLPNSDFKVLRELSGQGSLLLTTVKKNQGLYTWNMNGDVQTTLLDTIAFTNGQNGDYEICLEVTNVDLGCNSKTCKTVWLRDLGIATTSSASIRVFPTLVESHFTVETFSLKPENGSYQVFNVSGIRVAEGSLETAQTRVNVASLPAGAYFVKVQANNLVHDVKLIKL